MESYAKREGHVQIPEGWVEGGFSLYSWTVSQRVSFRERKLSPDRVQRLSEVEGWVWEPYAEKWEAGFDRLMAFRAREGHIAMPHDWVEDGFHLSEWVSRQRQLNRQGRLSEERARRLTSVEGWSWDPTEGSWLRASEALAAFANREGHARPLRSCVEDGFKLGAWVQNQRTRRESLRSDQIEQLERLPGWAWNVADARWEEGFERLLQFVEREGHALVNARWVDDGYKLGVWVGTQRSARETMSVERRDRLEDVQGWSWDPFADAWEEGFERLVKFVDREGHAKVKATSVEGGFKLGVWVGTQRSARETMSVERRDRLEDVQGWSWDPLADAWEEGFERLVKFVDREGHAKVKATSVEGGFKLGVWVVGQRVAERDGRLAPDRAARLSELNGWVWDAR